MRLVIGAAALLLGSCAGALAQGAPAFNWGGLYLGANIGAQIGGSSIGSFSNTVQQFSNATVPGRGVVVVPGTSIAVPGGGLSGDTTVSAGLQGGYGFVLDNWVLGAEGDLRLGNQNSSYSYSTAMPLTAIQGPATATITRNVNSDFAWSLRARAGYAWDNFLAYATAGIAGGQFKVTGTGVFAGAAGTAAPCAPACTNTVTAVTNTVSGGDNLNPVGWTAGGGLDWAVGGPFSIGLEYRHSDYGSTTANFSNLMTTASVPTIPNPAGSSTASALPPLLDVTSTPVDLMDDSISFRINVHF